jgi:hypothetical protein
MTMISQSDFDSLALPIDLQGDAINSADSNAFVDKISMLEKEEDKALKSSATSKNCNSDELLAFVTEWEQSAETTTEIELLTAEMDTNALPTYFIKSAFEPTRRVVNVVPPKRFYRAFWFSTSRRILARSNNQPFPSDNNV